MGKIIVTCFFFDSQCICMPGMLVLGLGLGLALRTINVGLGLGTQGLGLNFKAKSRPNPTLLVYHQRQCLANLIQIATRTCRYLLSSVI